MDEIPISRNDLFRYVTVLHARGRELPPQLYLAYADAYQCGEDTWAVHAIKCDSKGQPNTHLPSAIMHFNRDDVIVDAAPACD